jgi:hypothetical protein
VTMMEALQQDIRPHESVRIGTDEISHGYYFRMGSKHERQSERDFLSPLAEQLLYSIEESKVDLTDEDIEGLLVEVGAAIRMDCVVHNRTLSAGELQYSIHFVPIMPMSAYKMTKEHNSIRAHAGVKRTEIIIAKENFKFDDDSIYVRMEVGYNAEYVSNKYSNFGIPSPLTILD